MGSDENDKGADDNEKPRHRVRVAEFSLGKTEVTQGHWRRIMGNNPSRFSTCGDDCPLENVSFIDAQAFIEKLNARTGRRYRLPTEAEWEYACRANRDTPYCGGDDADAVAWYDGNSGGKTHPVGGKAENGFGLYDMSGNVWEWVEDCYHESYRGAPGDGSAWTHGNCATRVLRGGSWVDFGGLVRSAYRRGYDPGNRLDYYGFRLALGRGASGR